MIINDLNEIESLYKVYGENLLSTPVFLKRLENSDFNFLFALLYELKDYGDSIIEDKYFINIKEKIETFDEFHKSILLSLYHKYFIFNSLSEYLVFYKECKKKSLDENFIKKIFIQDSACHIFECCKALSLSFSLNNTNNIFLSESINKEISEMYNIFSNIILDINLEKINCSYVFIDQINNIDFFYSIFTNIYSWCVSNA